MPFTRLSCNEDEVRVKILLNTKFSETVRMGKGKITQLITWESLALKDKLVEGENLIHTKHLPTGELRKQRVGMVTAQAPIGRAILLLCGQRYWSKPACSLSMASDLLCYLLTILSS